jgi:hypothetical protein
LGRERARGNSTEATKSHLSLNNNNNNNTEKAIENKTKLTFNKKLRVLKMQLRGWIQQ